jgi:mannose-6-phosphate isomerase-like protein (cupin superfamily)
MELLLDGSEEAVEVDVHEGEKVRLRLGLVYLGLCGGRHLGLRILYSPGVRFAAIRQRMHTVGVYFVARQPAIYGAGMEPVSTATAKHYMWGEVCDGWHLVLSAGFSVIEERMPPGATEQRHSHERARQFFYVLAGELTMEVSGTTHVLHAGMGLEIAPKQAHQAMNRSGVDVLFLVTSVPPSHGDRTAISGDE